MGVLNKRSSEKVLSISHLFYKIFEIEPLNMDGNGNQWQQNNGQRIEAIKQQMATMRQNLAHNGENLSEYDRAALRNNIRQMADQLPALRYGDAMRACASMKDLYGKPKKPY